MTKLVLLTLLLLVAAVHVDRSGSSTVSCDSAIMLTKPAVPTRKERVLLGRVAVPQQGLVQVTRVGGRWPYWTKAGLLIRANSPSVTIRVPHAWRRRVAIEWGDSGVVSSLRVAPCSTHPWNAYVGGFYLRRPACVPLIVRVGESATRVHFGVGRRCRG